MNIRSFFRAFLCLFVAILTASASAQLYQPAGAPADPEVEARWNYYRGYAQATELFKQLAEKHPEWCRLESIGKSYGGRELWVLTITNQERTIEEQNELPGMWIDGGIHANELQAVDVVLYTGWYLCEAAERTVFIEQLLNERVFYLMPMMSPDSRDAHMTRANTTHSPRTGQLPVDDDRDGLVDEDPPEDLNGDGSITAMYIRDPNGRLKEHPKYPGILVRAEDHEQGKYTQVGYEGYDNDGDGRINEDGDGSYDPNRDWAWQWQPKYVQRGAYRYPLSIPANRQVADFIMAHPNIAGGQSYHNTGGMILRGPGEKSDKWPAADLRVYDRLAERGEEMLPGYEYLETATGLYEVWGGETDWLYAMRGIFAFTNELNTPFNLFRKKPSGGGWIGPAEDRYKFDQMLLFGEGYQKLEEVDHPQYGKVLVGGQKKNWGRQPASFMLEEELHRNMAFTLFHADQCPLVEITSVDIEELGDGLREVTATIVNNRIMPTRSVHDVANGITAPDRVEISGDEFSGNGVKVIAAMISESLLFHDARDVERDPSSIRIDRIASRRPVYVRWIVAGEGTPKIVVRSVKGGRAEWPSE